ncbi:MAG: hypothetical protein A2667_01895 [Candidatus Wildermuthbacteria bacterium RIFCSPHIGHO2_01_FULL_47_27]|uniref:Uncharacterized protein n=2 Tax=Candidatus Wildermuthiibacteriota TaxID=1817923 RepID=A0A1G2RNQ1_9BACT|nr:MAG: hypothetical protein A2667_01895 [Candidatus Wildermuthbacteria bacterium RIFCSPHIGHO2_01_FULL_47_27]OHA67196.1 MAG: hypothetical protein A3D59_02425 [Candidatus Wildermuthbacteria bacterium RIFCSPHIGHO2_02_FULL_47_17]OHA74484.1 MAG: hypothetical protein A3A32_00830 [Candidatus Wildermuthbacteria bacterium RIFCSPLOWO2_01_FULL_48_35]OHA76710.1 MAG: hypothetical protein A3I38_01790 [Candidatus Wildermuthbacteria bacterium RIFCSPLOWO2_02_FULL_47_10]
MGAVQKPKNRPPRAKKLVFWLVMVLSALLLSLWWWNAAQKRINQFQGKNLWESAEFPGLNLPPLPEVGGSETAPE